MRRGSRRQAGAASTGGQAGQRWEGRPGEKEGVGWGADRSTKSAGGPNRGLAFWAPGFLGPGHEQGHGQEAKRRTSVLKLSGQAEKTGSPDGAFTGRKKKVSELRARAVRRVRGV